MINELLLNLAYIGKAFLFLFVVVIANITISVYYNTKKLKQCFDKEKFFDGLLKMMSIGVTTGLLALAVSFFPYVSEQLGVPITEEMDKTFTIAAIVVLYAKAIFKYFNKAYQRVDEVLNKKDIIDDLNKNS